MKDNVFLYHKLKEHMKKENITLIKLARLLGISPTSLHNRISRLKNNKSVYSSFLFEIEKAIQKEIFFK